MEGNKSKLLIVSKGVGGGDKKQTYILGFHLINALKLKKKKIWKAFYFSSWNISSCLEIMPF